MGNGRNLTESSRKNYYEQVTKTGFRVVLGQAYRG